VSLNELELQVQQLPKSDLEKFSQWFEGYREVKGVAGDPPGEVEAAQRDEVLRRRSEYLDNSAVASDWDDGFFDRLRQRLADARAQKTPGS